MIRVGDNVIMKRRTKTPYIVKITKVTPNAAHPHDSDYNCYESEYIMNAQNGRKKTGIIGGLPASYFSSLETFLDDRRVLIRKMEEYL